MTRFPTLVFLGCAALLAGCTVDDVDFTNKSCAALDECASGFTCDLATGRCFKDGTPPPGDAGRVLVDAATEPPDASAPRDAGPGSDASINLDGGGIACTPGSCSAGFTCDPGSSTCVACDSDKFCGVSCTACASGEFCGAGACAPCKVALHCGATCAACSGATPNCDGVACVTCGVDADCVAAGTGKYCTPAGCLACKTNADCGGGSYCTAGACKPCSDDLHCGATCGACGAGAPKCDGSKCVGCLVDSDCSGATCCQGLCVSGAPQLTAVKPPSALVGSPTTAVDLSGFGFTQCSQVFLGGKQFTPRSISATVIKLDVPATLLSQTGAFPVQVVNPGVGGGSSNPNSTSLGAPLKVGSNSVPVAMSQFKGVGYVALQQLRTIQPIDFLTFKLIGPVVPITTSGMPVAIASSGSSLLVGMRGNNRVDVIDTPLSTPSTTTLSLGNNPIAMDSEDTGEVVIAEQKGNYQSYSPFSGLSTTVRVASFFFSEFSSVGSALGSSLYVLPTDTSIMLVPPGSSSPAASFPNNFRFANVAVDRTLGLAYVTQSSSVLIIDLASRKTLGSIPINSPQFIEVNPTSGLAAVIPSVRGAYSVGVIDLRAGKTIAYLGAGGNRFCGSSNNDPSEALAVDVRFNRVMAGLSCDSVVEGFSLNAIFVNNPDPVVTSLSPPSAVAPNNGVDLPLKIVGSGFVPGVTVVLTTSGLGSYILVPSSVTATQLDVLVPAAAVGCGGTASFKITNPAPTGTSATISWAVTAATPVANNVIPASCPFTTSCIETILGSNFIPGCSRIVASGVSYTTSGSGTSIRTTTAVPPVAAPTSSTIYVTTPGASGISTQLTFTRN